MAVAELDGQDSWQLASVVGVVSLAVATPDFWNNPCARCSANPNGTWGANLWATNWKSCSKVSDYDGIEVNLIF